MTKKISIAFAAAAILALPALANVSSGPAVGEKITPFHPTHVTGPDAGTTTCPPCKYGNTPAVQVWVNGDDTANVLKIAGKLNEVAKKDEDFKAFIIFVVDPAKKAKMETTLKDAAKSTGYNAIAMAWVPNNSEYLKAYKIDKAAKNTVLVYKDRKVTHNWVNMVANETGVKNLTAAIQQITK